MKIEVKGVGFQNKGSELMLHAIVQRRDGWKQRGKKVELVVDASAGHYTRRARLQLYQKLWVSRMGRFAHLYGEMVPGRLRRLYGLVADSELDAILDASGFAYSEQWGPGPTEQMARLTARWKQAGKPVVLLPQAFGPFSGARIRRAMSQIVEKADLIFARDEDSYKHLKSLGLPAENSKIKLAPDFTCLVKGSLPEDWSLQRLKCAVVPNERMVRKTSTEVADEYLNLLVLVIQEIRAKKLEPFILIHDVARDRPLAEEISARVGFPLEIIIEDNPLCLKGILGDSHVVVASRYHALVSALTQGVPSLATSWSHKYEMLFRDFKFPEGIIDSSRWREEVPTKFERIAEPSNRRKIVEKLRGTNQQYMKQTERMWEAVETVLGIE